MTWLELYCNGKKIATEIRNAEQYDLVNVGGRLFKVELVKKGRNEYLARIDNDTFKIRLVEEGLGSYTLDIEGHVAEYRTQPSNGMESKNVLVLLSPLPGKVLAIRVKEGDEVKLGDELVIIESMKMQTTLRAERNGRIKEIKINEGEIIKRGQPIIEFMV